MSVSTLFAGLAGHLVRVGPVLALNGSTGQARRSADLDAVGIDACDRQVSVRLRHGECLSACRSLPDRIGLAVPASWASSRGPMLPLPRGWMRAQLTQDQDLPAVRLVDHRRGNPGRLALPGAAAAAIPHQSGHADSGDRPPAMIYTSQNQRSTGQAEVPGHLGRALPGRGRGTLDSVRIRSDPRRMRAPGPGRPGGRSSGFWQGGTGCA